MKDQRRCHGALDHDLRLQGRLGEIHHWYVGVLALQCDADVQAVMPYFPYSRQSKKKKHRGSITAKLLANLLRVAGVDHVITIDLHASQMQGFFKCPVDNLVAEPLLARWIRVNVPDWQEAVVVSKNPGGTKRVTSLADALKLSFGIVTTDRRRTRAFAESMASEPARADGACAVTGSVDAGRVRQDAPVGEITPTQEENRLKERLGVLNKRRDPPGSVGSPLKIVRSTSPEQGPDGAETGDEYIDEVR